MISKDPELQKSGV